MGKLQSMVKQRDRIRFYPLDMYLLWAIIVIKISDELVHEKERYKSISEELDQTFQELSGY